MAKAEHIKAVSRHTFSFNLCTETQKLGSHNTHKTEKGFGTLNRKYINVIFTLLHVNSRHASSLKMIFEKNNKKVLIKKIICLGTIYNFNTVSDLIELEYLLQTF